MKKVALLAVVGMFAYTSTADASGVARAASNAFNKAKSFVTGAINKGANLVKNVGEKIIGKGAELARGALKQAGGLVTGLLNKVGDAAKKLTGKAKDWMISKGMELANKLPGPFGDWAKKGVQFGAGALTGLQGKLNNVIDKGINWAQGATAAGVKMGSGEINKLKEMFKERLTHGVGAVKDVLHGKVQYVAGAVTKAMGAAQSKISGFLGGLIKKPALPPKPVMVSKPGVRPVTRPMPLVRPKPVIMRKPVGIRPSGAKPVVMPKPVEVAPTKEEPKPPGAARDFPALGTPEVVPTKEEPKPEEPKPEEPKQEKTE
jgi:hypothetical protein